MSELEIVISMFRREWSNMGKEIGLGALKEVAQEYNIIYQLKKSLVLFIIKHIKDYYLISLLVV